MVKMVAGSAPSTRGKAAFWSHGLGPFEGEVAWHRSRWRRSFAGGFRKPGVGENPEGKGTGARRQFRAPWGTSVIPPETEQRLRHMDFNPGFTSRGAGSKQLEQLFCANYLPLRHRLAAPQHRQAIPPGLAGAHQDQVGHVVLGHVSRRGRSLEVLGPLRCRSSEENTATCPARISTGMAPSSSTWAFLPA